MHITVKAFKLNRNEVPYIISLQKDSPWNSGNTRTHTNLT